LQEAWPQLALLLARWPNAALGAEEAAAPGMVQRIQAAALECLIRRAGFPRHGAPRFGFLKLCIAVCCTAC
jgi:hypothetical protein